MIPRLLTRAKAAEYCDMTPEAFSSWVKAGRLPGAISGTRRWDRAAIDAALDRLSGLAVAERAGQQASALDEWKAKRHGAGQA